VQVIVRVLQGMVQCKGTTGKHYGTSARTLRRKTSNLVQGLLAASPGTAQKAIRNLLSNPALASRLPASITNPKEAALDKAIADNAAEVLQANKSSGGQTLSQQQANSAAFAALAGSKRARAHNNPVNLLSTWRMLCSAGFRTRTVGSSRKKAAYKAQTST
jgi:hypothetical protein